VAWWHVISDVTLAKDMYLINSCKPNATQTAPKLYDSINTSGYVMKYCGRNMFKGKEKKIPTAGICSKTPPNVELSTAHIGS
jgi:hypothetical protein